MRNNPERLAWGVLLTSFFVCIGLAIAIPIGTRHYVLYAHVGQNVTLEVQRGPLSVTLAGHGAPIAIDEERDEIPERTVVATGSTAGRLVVHAPQADGLVIATAQLYDNTEVVLSSARSPRFSASRLPHRVTLEARAGRVRINVSSDDSRSTVVEVHTPHGTAMLAEGSYEVKVNGMTMEVTVRDGQASVTNNTEHTISLEPAERAVIDGQQIAGPLPAARNLILDSDFADPLGENWFSYNKGIQFEDQPAGQVQMAVIEGHSSLVIERIGVGHAETGVTQTLDVDVSDLRSLQLHLLLRIKEHGSREYNIPVCGSKGSECPVMVRIGYKDAHGVDREWFQGFYWRPDEDIPENPLECTTCATNNDHIKVEKDNWYTYDSPDLIPQLSQDGQAPTKVESVTIYASGHTYHSAIAEAKLIGIDSQTSSTHDLILDGDLADSLGESWISYNKDIEREDQAEGQIQGAEIEGRPVVVIEREGVGHAETGITQVLGADVSGFESLRLRLLLRIAEHNIPVCGSDGSECPVMVRIDYKDAYGVDREWLQGFYWRPNRRPNPLVCTTCATRNEHIRVREDTWYPYLSPNLIPQLSQDGEVPTAIRSITIYASGHAYHSTIAEVELIGEE